MLFSTTSSADLPVAESGAPQTAGISKIVPADASKLPAKTADTGKIRLGGACRLPVKAA